MEMFKKITVALAASALVIASGAQAGAASLSLSRASTVAKKDNKLAPPIIGVVAVLGVIGMLEAAEAIDLFKSDDSDSN